MEKLHYYVLMYFYQYEPYTAFQGLYAHREPLNFKQVWEEVRNELEANYPYAAYDEDEDDDDAETYNEFIERKADEALAARGFIKLEVDIATIGPDDSYDTFYIWDTY